ncbi:hypothetical protein [Mycobacterium sp. pW045]
MQVGVVLGVETVRRSGGAKADRDLFTGAQIQARQPEVSSP